MKKFSFINPHFEKSAVAVEDYPRLTDEKGRPLPEVAIAGRSNVGKSSLLNYLFQTKHLVKVSATPGKTQLINFFTINQQLAFVDLPGYGYAKVPHGMKKQWGTMVQSYLDSRTSLKLILFLMDIRRIPNEEDLQLLDWIVHAEKQMILVFTKVDKVSQHERLSQTKKIIEVLDYQAIPYVHTSSSIKKEGRERLIQSIQQMLN